MPSPADELRMRLGHAITLLSPIARSSGVIGDWRDVWLSVTLAAHELEGADADPSFSFRKKRKGAKSPLSHRWH
jgi:hypothetical protein